MISDDSDPRDPPCCRVYCYSVCRISSQTWECSVGPPRGWTATSWPPRWWGWPGAWCFSGGRCWCWLVAGSAPTGHQSASHWSHCGLNNNLLRGWVELINCANIISRWTLNTQQWRSYWDVMMLMLLYWCRPGVSRSSWGLRASLHSSLCLLQWRKLLTPLPVSPLSRLAISSPESDM